MSQLMPTGVVSKGMEDYIGLLILTLIVFGIIMLVYILFGTEAKSFVSSIINKITRSFIS